MKEEELETWLKIQEIEDGKKGVLKYSFSNDITVWYEYETNTLYIRGVDISEKEFYISEDLVLFLGTLDAQIKKHPTLVVLKEVFSKNFLVKIGVLYQ